MRPSERVHLIDALRGFALFGILVVNVLDYAPESTGPLDTFMAGAIALLAEGSFFPLFSLLFGVGFAIFLDRAMNRGASGPALFVRRLIGLFLFAVAQYVFLEDRNILLRYSIVALPLLAFYRVRDRTLLIAALICLLLAAVHTPLNLEIRERQLRDPGQAEWIAAERTALAADRSQRLANWEAAAASGSYLRMVEHRAEGVVTAIGWSGNFRRNGSLLHILAMFLFGAWVWRRGLLRPGEASRRIGTHWLIGGGLVGLAGNTLVLGLDAAAPILRAPIEVLGNTALTFGYVGAFLVFIGGRPLPGVATLALVGRMGLTNYLMQSVGMGLIFLPYAGGLAGSISLSGCVLLGVLIFAAHVPLSVWWLNQFRFGPAEWLWRCLTYGRIQPLRIRTPVLGAGMVP